MFNCNKKNEMGCYQSTFYKSYVFIEMLKLELRKKTKQKHKQKNYRSSH